MTFEGEFRGNAHERNHLHESPPVMTMPLVVLAVGAAIAGLIGIPEAITFGEADLNFFHHFLEPSIAEIHGHEAHGHLSLAVEWALILVSVGIAVAGILIAPDLGRSGGTGAGRGLGAALPDRAPRAGEQVLRRRALRRHRGTRHLGPGPTAVAVRRRGHRRAGQLLTPLHGGDRAAVGFLRPLRRRWTGESGGYALSQSSRVFRRVQTGLVSQYALVVAVGVLALVFTVVILR